MVETIYYKDVISRGFIREDINDRVAHAQNGYDPFIVYRNFTKDTSLDWNESTKTVTLVLNNESGNIIQKRLINSLVDLDTIIEELESLNELQNFINRRILKLFVKTN